MAGNFVLSLNDGSVLKSNGRGAPTFVEFSPGSRCKRFETAEKAYSHLCYLQVIYSGSDTLRSAFVSHARRTIELARTSIEHSNTKRKSELSL